MIAVDFSFTQGADQNLGLPEYQSSAAAAMDLRANFDAPDRDGVLLGPAAFVLVPTGLRIAIPEGYEAQIRPRSGLALKHGVTVLNAPGTIDADYRGPIGVILINHGPNAFKINHGDRIAQILFAPVTTARWNAVGDLTTTQRGQGGFGSTGAA